MGLLSVINLLPVSSKFIFQYLRCSDGQVNVQRFSLAVGPILSFLTEDTRTLQGAGVFCAGSGGCPVCRRRGCEGSAGLRPSRESRTHTWSFGALAALVGTDGHRRGAPGPLPALAPQSALLAGPLHPRLSPAALPVQTLGAPGLSSTLVPPTCSAHVCTCPLATACLRHRGLLPEWPVTVDQQTSPPSGCTSAPSMEV